MATLEGAFGAIPPSSGRFAHCEPRHGVLPPSGPHLGPFTIHHLPQFPTVTILCLRLVYALAAHPDPKHAIDFRAYSLYALIGRRPLNVKRKKKINVQPNEVIGVVMGVVHLAASTAERMHIKNKYSS